MDLVVGWFAYGILSAATVAFSMVVMWATYGRPQKSSMLLIFALYALIVLHIFAAFTIGYLVSLGDRETGTVMMAAVIFLPLLGSVVMGLILRSRRSAGA